jgi:2-C-methyl-D-erythritol 4-phosphate cytidylyltransferase / 2-C-methyl-D-erythritol 2,4-cyclodiphosphate synthase
MTQPDVVNSSPIVAAIIVAAGRGTRASSDLPKQYVTIAGMTVLERSIRNLAAEPRVGKIICVIHRDDQALYARAIAPLEVDLKAQLHNPVYGGETRQASSLAGLEALAMLSRAPDLVLIHDAARPFVSQQLVASAIDMAALHGAAIPGLQVTDTIAMIDAERTISDTPQRSLLRAVQTPQSFAFQTLLNAHRRAARAKGELFTDDASVARFAGLSVYVFEGEPNNVKLTLTQDIIAAEEALSKRTETRTGIGYDVHAFVDGDAVILGGIPIPHTHRLSGHSDADVALHAITDAIYGALADGDIGSHFPPSDPQWKNADSAVFLRHAVDQVRLRHGSVINVDLTIICEAPKIDPYRDAMRQRIADICNTTIDRVGVKATTTEQLGFTGRREGIAAQAVTTLSLPVKE